MRYLRILLLHFEYVFEHRGRSFVWFLIVLTSPLVFLLFWNGALDSKTTHVPGWTSASFASYYFFLIIAGALLMSHVEEDVSREDIRQGELVKYIIRPFSYYWFNFFEELPYRVLQGFYGVVFFFILTLFFNIAFEFTTSLQSFLLSVVIAIFAYFISYTFKMILGLTAFWLTDTYGFYHLTDMAIFIFAGYSVPLQLFPQMVEKIAYWLPFAYMIYFPIISFQGKLSVAEQVFIIMLQGVWLCILVCLYKFIWHKGIQKFSGVGQ